MELKLYLILLILFATLSSKICASSEYNTSESSNVHIRKKRLININPRQNKKVSIVKVPYMVDIQKNGKRFCGGTILSSTIIITAAHCLDRPGIYTILSGSGRINRGIRHNVTKIEINRQYCRSPFVNDIALVKISPPIDFLKSRNRHIELHDGNIQPPFLGTISGWGCTHWAPPTIIYPDELRSISVPLISQKVCEDVYLGYAPITVQTICTYDRTRTKSACAGDSGGPLVVNGRLLGVYVYNKKPLKYPDVHIKVSESAHAVWISATMRMLNDEF